MMRKLMSKFTISILTAFILSIIPLISHAAGDSHASYDKQHWSFDGIFGKYEQNNLQRGFQVYKEVCAACHSLKYLSYRNLADLGYSEAQIKAVAAEYEVTDGPNDEGEYYQRPALPSDRFVPPFPNDEAARYANGGALPIDLSLIGKSRKDSANYLYALLISYKDEAPADIEVSDGLYYNEVFSGNLIAMPPPLFEDQVTYQDGHDATVAQMSYDVVNFLMWAAEPHLEERKSLGIKVILFLIFFVIILYAHKRRLWKTLH